MIQLETARHNPHIVTEATQNLPTSNSLLAIPDTISSCETLSPQQAFSPSRPTIPTTPVMYKMLQTFSKAWELSQEQIATLEESFEIECKKYEETIKELNIKLREHLAAAEAHSTWSFFQNALAWIGAGASIVGGAMIGGFWGYLLMSAGCVQALNMVANESGATEWLAKQFYSNTEDQIKLASGITLTLNVVATVASLVASYQKSAEILAETTAKKVLEAFKTTESIATGTVAIGAGRSQKIVHGTNQAKTHYLARGREYSARSSKEMTQMKDTISGNQAVTKAMSQLLNEHSKLYSIINAASAA